MKHPYVPVLNILGIINKDSSARDLKVLPLISIGVDLANGETLFEWKPLSSFPVIIEKNETKFFFFLPLRHGKTQT